MSRSSSANSTHVGNYFVSNYPPYSTWTPEEVRLHESGLWRRRGGPVGLYVHVPFCRQRCHYCYFRVYPRSSVEVVDAYVDAVLAEHELYQRYPATGGRRPVSVYFGGGSPSYLRPEQLDRLLGGLQKRVSWDLVEECTFECEPHTIDTAKLAQLRALGVTRVSIGMQTLTDTALRRVGRDQTRQACIEAFEAARSVPGLEINVDLLAGMPSETEEGWLDTIETVARLGPDCVTIYQLELAWNSVLHLREQRGMELRLADWPTKRRWIDAAFNRLEEAGYTIASGYMAVRDPARFRFVYTVEHFWHGADLLALGEASFGHIGGVHYQNVDRLEGYLTTVSEGRLPVRRARRISCEEALRREAILQLKTGRLRRVWFQRRFGIDIEEHFAAELGELERRGFLERDEEGVQLTREGLLRVDGFLKLFYLPEHRDVRYT